MELSVHGGWKGLPPTLSPTNESDKDALSRYDCPNRGAEKVVTRSQSTFCDPGCPSQGVVPKG